MKRLLLYLIGLIFLLIGLQSGAQLHAQSNTEDQDTMPATDFSVVMALNRVTPSDWSSVTYTDFDSTMAQLDLTWQPVALQANGLSEQQALGWEGVWRPSLFNLELNSLGFSAYEVQTAVEARRGNSFTLWLEGAFDIQRIVEAIPSQGYELITDFPAEAYQATDRDSQWANAMPFVSIPDGRTLLIASSRNHLADLLSVYDGLIMPVVGTDSLLTRLEAISPNVISARLRFDANAVDCPIESSRVVMHGIQYDASEKMWQYVLNVGYPSETIVTNLRSLGDALEYSTYPTSDYGGVLGQHTDLLDHTLYEDNQGSIVQFLMRLKRQDNPYLHHLPIELGAISNTCRLFEMPSAASVSQALPQIPDLSGGYIDITIRYGNAEQALYNAGLNPPLTLGLDDTFVLNDRQTNTLNSTWRTALAYETSFEEWFGFSPRAIRQTIELGLDRGEYTRIVWGDFSTETVEDALDNNGYIAAERHLGARIFTLRNAPDSGGILLASSAQTLASPQDGVLVFANSMTNMRITLDIFSQTFVSSLSRARELMVTARALKDATNVTLRRYFSPRADRVCGMPSYKVEAFANIARSDGWYFLYALGYPTAIQEPDVLIAALAKALETSDYPMQGPGSQTFGELSSVTNWQIVEENSAMVLLVELAIDPAYAQASFFGQEMVQASLAPCILGDITQQLRDER